MSNHKRIESAIKNLEIQVGKLAKQLAENSSSTFGANTEKNPKEECKVVITRGRKATIVEDEDRTVDDKQELVVKGSLNSNDEGNSKINKNAPPENVIHCELLSKTVKYKKKNT